MTKSRLNLVYVLWIDSGVSAHGWNELEELTAEKLSPPIIESIGYLVHEHEEFITITTTVSEDEGVYEPFTIPKGCIKKLRRLRYGKND